MTVIRALADDLTGAFDAGASFVSLSGPIPIAWSKEHLPLQGSYILDNETRQLEDASLAKEKTLSDLKLIKNADIAFKKIDSLMRGHTIAEIETCIKSQQFASVVVAPSFPQQKRITRDNQQYAKFFPEDDWHAVGPNLSNAFPGQRHITFINSSSKVTGDGLFIYDAETEEDMTKLPEILSSIQEPILWCGSAGLAKALSGKLQSNDAYEPASTLVIIGSQHPVSHAQLRAINDVDPNCITIIDEKTHLNETADAVNKRLTRRQHGVIALSITTGPSSASRDRLSNMIHRLLPQLIKPERLFAMGGDTLLATLRAVEARQTSVKGELIPGVAIGEITGGLWDHVTFLSKSGAFGQPSFLRNFLTSCLPEQH